MPLDDIIHIKIFTANGNSKKNPPPEPSITADSVWTTLSVMPVVNPMNFGAVGDGVADDFTALQAAVAALPTSGGIVFLPSGKSFRKNTNWPISKNHLKFWSVNRGAEIFQSTSDGSNLQALLPQNTTGFGAFGVQFRSDATARKSTLYDNQIALDHVNLVEIVGNYVFGSAAVGVFMYGADTCYVEGNYVYKTCADHIHHTNATKNSWVWNNWIYNDLSTLGDDGVAVVTYGPGGTRSSDIEIWRNYHLGSGNGRGYAVVGGDRVFVHHNWARNTSAAGLLIASESAKNTSASQDVTTANNFIDNCGIEVGGHTGILISSGNETLAGPLVNITLTNNISQNNIRGDYRTEGTIVNLVSTGLNYANLPSPGPMLADRVMADTSVLRTRDVSHAPSNTQRGMYRIHVRQAANGGGFQQRFEYVVKAASGMAAFLNQRSNAGDYVSETRNVSGTDYAVLLTGTPFTLPNNITEVTFSELRSGDNTGALSWLWSRVDGTAY